MKTTRTHTLAAALLLATATVATAGTTATAQTNSVCEPRTYRAGLSGDLHQCTWDDGRTRVVGTLRDTALSDGATLINIRIGSYSRQWTICGSDTPVDTDYQPGDTVSLTYRSVGTDLC